MKGLEKEAFIFIHAVLSGMAVYGFYGLIRILRRIVRHSLLFISVEDFLFWVGTAFYLFIQMYRTSSGNVRWFFVLGVAVGMIFLAIFTEWFRKMWKKFWKRCCQLGKKKVR